MEQQDWETTKIYNQLRVWSSGAVRKAWGHPFPEFRATVRAKAEVLNSLRSMASMYSDAELDAITDLVARYVWETCSPEEWERIKQARAEMVKRRREAKRANDPRNREIVRLRGQGWSWTAIGKQLSISPNCASRAYSTVTVKN